MGTAAGNADIERVSGGLSQYNYWSCSLEGSAALVGRLVRSVHGRMLKMSCASRRLPAAGLLLIWGQSYGVTAFLLVCLAPTYFEVEKGSVLGSADLHADLGAVRLF